MTIEDEYRELLKQALEFDSQTVRDFNKMRAWRLNVVSALGMNVEAERRRMKEDDALYNQLTGCRRRLP